MSSRAGHGVLRDARWSVVEPHPRSKDVLITQKLEFVWPSVSARLTAMLRRRGVGPHDADEAIQETAARAVSSSVAFADADDLFRWASVVSWRIAIDAHRRCTRVTGGEVPDRADQVDVAQSAEHRIVLSAVTSRFKDLPDRDQAVLLSSFDDHAVSSRAESVRLAVARHRARSRLRSLLDGLLAPIVGFAARRWRWRTAPVEAFASSAVPALACLALSVGTLGTPPAPRSQLPPVVSVATAEGQRAATTSPAVSATSPRLPVAAGDRTRPTRTEAGTVLHLPPTPDGQSTDIGSRPSQATDHLACATLPSLTGPSTTCLDPPAIGR